MYSKPTAETDIFLNPQDLVKSTRMLDFHSENIQALIKKRTWNELGDKESIAHAMYEFCRDEILFGYNSDGDDMSASRVLTEGVGHCNTKATLLLALLRSANIPCRLHAFTIDKQLQRGALTPFVYFMAPREIVHTWVEAKIENRWIALEGLILDKYYLDAVQRRFTQCTHPFLGYAVATPNLQKPRVEWTGGDTYIQREGIVRELGIYASPDEFYVHHATNLSGLKGWFYRRYFYKQLNKNISNIRNSGNHAIGENKECDHK
jgi:Transglutaminase-like superfamily